MIALYFMLFSSVVFADPTLRWTSAVDVVEKHEFYNDHEVIIKPQDTWQTLFGVTFLDGRGVLAKDCLYFRVPGKTLGVLRMRTISATESCEKYIFEDSPEKWENIKTLEFAVTPERISLSMQFPDYKSEKWDIPRLNMKPNIKPELNMSSAEFRSGSMIFLSSVIVENQTKQETPVSVKKLCHAISDDCQELSPSTCGTCDKGWYEIPNGCSQGPKYCGVLECGKKHQPACRRGYVWQRVNKKFDCNQDSSFAYCSKGLVIQCHGAEAFCL
jgi:hypothetical protein